MAFIVRFVNHNKTVFIAKLVKLRAVRIMAGTDTVDIMLLHQAQIPVDLFQRDGKAGNRVAVMAVGAVNL